MATSSTSSKFTGAFNGFLSYTPVIPTGPATSYTASASKSSDASSSSSSKGTTLGGLDEAMVKLLYEQGLESDVAEFLTDAEWAIEHAYNPVTGKPVLSMYKMILPKLAKLKTEKEQFTKALDQARSKGSLSEIAITTDGQVFVVNKEGMTIKSIGEVLKGTDHILTNGELANFRASDTRGAFNLNITNIVASGVSMSDVTSYIQDVANKLGTSENQADGYINRQGAGLKAGLEYLQSLKPTQQGQAAVGMSLEGIYKANGLTLDLISQAESALAYIMLGMPTNMKTLLMSKADGTEKGAATLALTLINSKLSNKSSLSLDYKGPESKITADPEGPNKDKMDMDNVLQFLAGYGAMLPYKLNVGSSYSMYVNGLIGTMDNARGELLKSGDSLVDVLGSRFGSILQWNSVTMGGERIEDSQLDRVIVGSPQIVRMALPVDVQAKNATGVVKPDLDMTKRMEAANDELRQLGIVDLGAEISADQLAKINEIYVKHSLQPKYNNGQLNTLVYAQFAVIAGNADESAFVANSDLQYIDEIENPALREAVERALKAKDKKYSASSGIIFGVGKTHLYSGSVFIPIIDNVFNASQGSHNFFLNYGRNAQQAEAIQLQLARVPNIKGINISALD